jgi:hypothetical protein
MTQYDDRVAYQKAKIDAEKWANGVKMIHAHSLDSCYYAEGRSDGSVMDIQYNDGRVQRTINSTGEVIILNMENTVTGSDLVRAFERGSV